MNSKHYVWGYFFLIFLSILLLACGQGQGTTPALTPTPVGKIPATIQPTATEVQPTVPPSATLPPSASTPLEEITVPDCVPNNPAETLAFDEALLATVPKLNDMDELGYQVVYQYKAGDAYPEEELAVDIEAYYSGLLPDQVEADLEALDYSARVSQWYEKSHVSITDLHTNTSSEVINNGDSIWIRTNERPEWLAFHPGDNSNLNYLFDFLSPQGIVTMLTKSLWEDLEYFGGDKPAMVQEDTLKGRSVTHRCWISSDNAEDVDGVLMHWVTLYTYLQDVEFHLWTTADDSELVRVVVAGQSDGWWLKDIDFYKFDPPYDFLLWLDTLPMTGQEFDSPAPDQVAANLPSDLPAPDQLVEAPHNQFVLPGDATPLDPASLSELEFTWQREFSGDYIDNSGALLVEYLGPAWNEVPENRLPFYLSQEDLWATTVFYIDEMSKRGWTLQDFVLQSGIPQNNLVFTRNGINQPIMITPLEKGDALIWSVLPPDETQIENITGNWKKYDAGNSGLTTNEVVALDLSPNGDVWVATQTTGGNKIYENGVLIRETPLTPGGVSVFDGKVWAVFTEDDLSFLEREVRTLAVDEQGQAWISTEDELMVLDGSDWESFSKADYGLDRWIEEIEFDPTGNVWIMTRDGVASFNGGSWTNHKIIHEVMSLELDLSGQPWILTTGGLFTLEDDEWIQQDIPNSIYLPPFIGPLSLPAFLIDGQGRMWLTAENGSLEWFNGETWTNIPPSDLGAGIQIEDIALDPQDRIWILSHAGHLYMVDADGTWFDFSPLDPALALSEPTFDRPSFVKIDGQGRVWVGTG